MKKRILLTALLVVPMNIIIAWHEGTPHTQTSTITTGEPEAEAALGTQSVNINQPSAGAQGETIAKCVPGQPILGTQGITGYTTCEQPLGTQDTTNKIPTNGEETQGQARLGTQSVNIRQNGSPLGTQSSTISTGTLGTQAYTR